VSALDDVIATAEARLSFGARGLRANPRRAGGMLPRGGSETLAELGELPLEHRVVELQLAHTHLLHQHRAPLG
jgi:hypothetical protein